MKTWLRRFLWGPANLLEGDPLVEVIVTCDREGWVRCTTSHLEDPARSVEVISSLFACARGVMAEAQKIATDRGVKLQTTEDGNILVG